jgi:predicted SAM-dependent methyltransferase
MNWKIKAVIQKLLQHTPRGEDIHFHLQKLGGGLKNAGMECKSKIQDWEIMVNHLLSAGIDLEKSSFMEIGTGWYPTFPICLYLVGANKVFSLDLNTHLRPDLTDTCLKVVGENLALIKKYSRSPDETDRRYDELVRDFVKYRDISKASSGKISYLAPADAAKTAFNDGQLDVVFSNSVLEHIPGNVIEDIMREAYRILKISGCMFHSVNCGDHYSYIDSNINQLHYLQYSEKEWETWTNRFLYQNRIRAKDFTAMAKKAGFKIDIDTSTVKDLRMKQLAEIKVADCFADYTKEELCLTTIDFLARK